MSRRAALLLEGLLLVGVIAAGGWLRVHLGKGWTYGGADTWTYVGAAVELRARGTYAVRMPKWVRNAPKEPAPSYCRLPLYPIFIAAVSRPKAENDPVFLAQVKRAQVGLDLVTCLLVFLLARALAGRLAAWPAVLLVAASPLMAVNTACIMSETLTAALTTGTVLLLALALDAKASPRRTLLLQAGAGLLVALVMLTRPEGAVLALALFVPLAARERPWRRRLREVGVALAVCAVAFSPWPVRNLARFGEAHPFATQCGLDAKPLPRLRFLRWFATWLTHEEQLPKTLWCFYRSNCNPDLKQYPPQAFGSDYERRVVGKIFLTRSIEGDSARVDRAFHNLALYRLVTAPFRTLVKVPAQRAYYLWFNSQEQPLRAAERDAPLPATVSAVRPYLDIVARGQALLAVLGVAVLLFHRGWSGRRRLALLVLVVIGGRTAFLALTGLVEGRYIVPAMPVALAVAGVAVAVALKAFRRRGSEIEG
jgi:4-amino-4-deoxy-L-arabinose transferase-like glycosyltransferase